MPRGYIVGIMKLAPGHTGKTHKTNLVPRRNKLTFSTLLHSHAPTPLYIRAYNMSNDVDTVITYALVMTYLTQDGSKNMKAGNSRSMAPAQQSRSHVASLDIFLSEPFER